jgi:predicted small secreted protein
MWIMKTRLKQTALLLLAVAILALTSVINTGCGTARGFGHDLGNVGHGIERVAR